MLMQLSTILACIPQFVGLQVVGKLWITVITPNNVFITNNKEMGKAKPSNSAFFCNFAVKKKNIKI